jgi:APA family basic amino acid/polyamine antiporter
VYPTSGGSYIYGRERLGPWWGFVAGWGFIVGKTASCAAMALTAAAYAVPGPSWVQRLIGVAVVLGLAALNYRGVSKTAATTRVLVSISLVVLAAVIIGIGVRLVGPYQVSDLGRWGGPYGVLQASGLMFFAFAGYARIATMGEEVRNPERTIPRAISIAFTITVAVYLATGLAVLLAAGPTTLAGTTTPLVAAVDSVGLDRLATVVRIGAIVASLGALLALMAGVGRTSLAMARHRDLPRQLAAVHPRFAVPHHAEMALAVVVSVLVVTVDIRGVIGFSSFGVLVYYAIANAAAYTLPRGQRRTPRILQIVGAAGCAVLVVTLPVVSVIAGIAVFAIGLAGRWVVLRRRRMNGT